MTTGRDGRDVSDVLAEIGDGVPLRAVTDDDFLLGQLLALGALEVATGAEVVEARHLAADADEESFLVVVQRDGGFDAAQEVVRIELGEESSPHVSHRSTESTTPTHRTAAPCGPWAMSPSSPGTSAAC